MSTPTPNQPAPDASKTSATGGDAIDKLADWILTADYNPRELRQAIQAEITRARIETHEWYIAKAKKVAEVMDSDLQEPVTLESIVIAAKYEVSQLKAQTTQEESNHA